MMQRHRCTRSLKEGSSVSVSAHAFIIRLPIEGSAAQCGISPQCMSRHSLPPLCRTITGMLGVVSGAMLKRGVYFGRSRSGSSEPECHWTRTSKWIRFFTLQNSSLDSLTSTIDSSWVGLQTIPRMRSPSRIPALPCANVKTSILFWSHHRRLQHSGSGSTPVHDSSFVLPVILRKSPTKPNSIKFSAFIRLIISQNP